MPNFISEDNIEQATIKLLTENFGYRHINCFTRDANDLNDKSGRTDKREVVFKDILIDKVRAINPEIPHSAIDNAIEILTRKRGAMSLLLANKEIYNYIKDGIPIEYKNEDEKTEQARVKIIDFKNEKNNDFLAVTQLWIRGESYWRRPDILLYVNGIPLVFIELKNSNVKLKQAYDKNLLDYKKDIPQLFLYNGFCVLSNALESKVGSYTSGWEYFFKWLRAEDEKEKVNTKEIKKSGTSLERIISGLFPQNKLLDYLENFILYYNDNAKLVAQNHQFIGVNKSVESFAHRKEKKGKLGVFWHTQGSGKSFSMIFLYRKISRKFKGNFSFVIVTDRNDLDGQIYRNFLNTESVTEGEVAQPKNCNQMRNFLSQNKRIVFTLIQKFRYDIGRDFPLLLEPKENREVIVIVDEAHRTQYKSLAENMRAGLKGAHFYAFTGTPLLGKHRQTSAWFGDYVSEYNFSQAIDDESTVPLFYQKRVPEVLNQNDELNDDFYKILEDENLDDKQQEKLEKEFATELHIIKRDDRLETIAKDIAYHFPRRGYLGKGMVISVDKFTAVKMYDKVQKYWKEEIKRLTGEKFKVKSEIEKEKISKIIEYMRSVEMCVILSEEAGETEKFQKRYLDIKPHRDKMNAIDENGHDIEFRFKDPKDKFQLVFVCAMWLTGFDAPTLSTLYIDKPMKDHTLMQAIARANRVTSHFINGVSKKNGELIDYINVFRNMKKALAAYAIGNDEEQPVRDKADLFKILDEALIQGTEFCNSIGVDIKSILDEKDTFKNLNIFYKFADIILSKDEWKREFYVYENTISSLYESCKPEILSNKRPLVFVFQYLRGVINSIILQQDIDSAKYKINELLDHSIITAKEDEEEKNTSNYAITKGVKWNLGNVDFEKLKEKFRLSEYKNIEITNLRSVIKKKLEKMMKENCTRIKFSKKFQQIIDNYNSSGTATEQSYDDLTNFAEELNQEDERHIKEGLTIDELELFDILKKSKMTIEEKKKIKLAAKHLLHRLKEETPRVLVQDWFKGSQSKEKVKTAVEEVLDLDLPTSYDLLFKDKCESVFDLIYDYAQKGEKWVA